MYYIGGDMCLYDDDYNEIERMFNIETRDKKVIARGVRNRATRLGKIGKMVTPYDLMSKKEQKRYANIKIGSESLIMINDIKSYQEFMLLDMENRKRILLDMLTRYSVKELADKWNIKSALIQGNLHRMNIKVSDIKSYPGKKPWKTKGIIKKENGEEIEMFSQNEKEEKSPFKIILNAEGLGSSLESKFTAAGMMLDKGKSYRISLVIEEIECDDILEGDD